MWYYIVYSREERTKRARFTPRRRGNNTRAPMLLFFMGQRRLPLSRNFYIYNAVMGLVTCGSPDDDAEMCVREREREAFIYEE